MNASDLNRDALLSEKDWSEQIRQYARLRGWRYYHTYRSTRSPEGYPDITLVRPPRVVFAELKRERGRVTHAQNDWLAALRHCPGVETYLWRPSDWPAVRIALA
jgi:hypothetical protein